MKKNLENLDISFKNVGVFNLVWNFSFFLNIIFVRLFYIELKSNAVYEFIVVKKKIRVKIYCLNLETKMVKRRLV